MPVLKDLIAGLASLQRYDISIGGGCECCGTWVEKEPDERGDWVRWEDIASLLGEPSA